MLYLTTTSKNARHSPSPLISFLLASTLLAQSSVIAAQSVDSAPGHVSISISNSSSIPSTGTSTTSLSSDETILPSSSSTSSIVSLSSLNLPGLISSSTSTCASRTVNYITHTLPQQCIKTNRIAATSYLTAESAVGITAVAKDGNEPTATDKDVLEAQETDSPLDNANFLSFEEWKQQNLARVVHQSEPVNGMRPDKKQIEIALESLGQGSEFDMGISFGHQGKSESATKEKTGGKDSTASSSEKPAPSGRPRKKDAGTTCKERSNYASLDCAATVHKTNSKCKSPAAILNENKDTYMLNECSTINKFLIVELCDDILVDTVVLANFEFFSSMFRTFRVSVSDKYPVKMDRWKELGVFEARNAREIQAFAIENPLIWARYLRIEFLTHFGAEFYCPVSLLRIHGTTMLEEMRNTDESARGEDDGEDEVVITPPVDPAPLPASAVVEIKDEVLVSELVKQTEALDSSIQSTSTTIASEMNQQIPSLESKGNAKASLSSTSTGPNPSPLPLVGPAPSPSKDHKIISSVLSSGAELGSHTSVRPDSNPVSRSIPLDERTPQLSIILQTTALPSSKITSSSVDNKSLPNSNPASSPASGATSKSQTVTKETTKSLTSGVQPPAPSPTTQESFFKSFQKRLQVLEVNATLSLQYIEEQSRILRDAFTKVEKRQMGKIDDFVRHLNSTVMTELKSFRQQYDQLWQSTVIELDTHRDQYQKEILAVSSRLSLLADELVFQKRMAVVQSTLLVLCLGLIIFVRSGGGHLELPIMQQVLHKSHSVLGFPFDSPRPRSSSKENSPLRDTRRLIRVRSVDDLEDSEDETRLMNSPSPSPPGMKKMNMDDFDYGAETSKAKQSMETPDLTPIQSPIQRTPSSAPHFHDLLRPSKSGPATPRGTLEDQDSLRWIDRTVESSPLSRSNSIYDSQDSSITPEEHIRHTSQLLDDNGYAKDRGGEPQICLH